MAQLTRHLAGPGIGRNQELARIQHRFARCQQHMRPDVARDEINIVLLHQLVGGLFAGIGGELIVAKDDLDIQIAGLAAQMLDRQIDGVFHVFANHRGGCGQRGDKADFHAIGPASACQRRCSNRCQ